QDN
ncbi:hypothetical protein D049_4784B, partial [Vibrio parahaemolyticus VPTS-2010]